MIDARRTDLNYGHFGQPVYDIESQQWCFPRNVQKAPQLQQLGESRLLIPSQLSSISGNAVRTRHRRQYAIEQLVRACPELAPGSALLPSLAEESEAIEENDSTYDPATSDLLSFGRAYQPLHHRESSKTVSIIAIPGGAAGEFVRVIQLVPAIVGWDDESDIKLQDESFRRTVQGFWYGNGSRIQQLQFAKSNGEPTEWLAIRYGGTTSILRAILRENDVPASYRTPHPALEADVELRLELQHIVTLTIQRSGGAPHADVCFNPWDPREFAIVDQSSHWTTWKISSIDKKIGTWMVAAGNSGDVAVDQADSGEDSDISRLKLDGWGAVRWISNGACLLVCNRRLITCFKLQDPPADLPMPDLDLKKTKCWVLDVKESPTNPDILFIATSSRIFWLHLDLENSGKGNQPQLKARILLTWTHFRNELDASLSMQVVDMGSMVTILLYSRLTALNTVFTFETPQLLVKLPSSVCDPYMFPYTNLNNSASPRCLSLAFNVLPHESHRSQIRDGYTTWYLKCVALGNDLSLSEWFIVASSHQMLHPLGAPQSQSRLALLRKSLYRADDDFIVPNGILDSDGQEAWSVRTPSLRNTGGADRHGTLASDLPPSRDEWTIDFEWLTDHINSTQSTPLNEVLQPVVSRFVDRIEALDPGIVSLAELIDQEVVVDDIDEGSTALGSLVSDVKMSLFADHDLNVSGDPISISRFMSISPPSLLLAGPDGSLSQTYDALVTFWITPLAAKVPGRICTWHGRMIRGVAAELQLASYGFSLPGKEDQAQEQSQSTSIQEKATFALPVSGMPAFSDDSRRVRAKAIEQASSQVGSSRISDDRSSLAAAGLPTPEPTPSLRSQGSQASRSTPGASEDLAVQRLGTLAELAPQPRLLSVMTGIQSHWVGGQNPYDYEWEMSMGLVERGDKPEDAEEVARGKKKQRKERSSKRQMETTMPSLFQTMPIRPAASQGETHGDQLYSSQPTLVTASQPLPGPHGGATKLKKGRKKGF